VKARRVAEGALGVALLAFAAFAEVRQPAAVPAREPMSGLTHGAAGDTADPVELRGLDSVTPVASYTLHAKLDPATHTVAGSGEIRFVNVSSRALDHLYVHLYLNAFESQRTVFGRQRSGGFRGNTRLDAPGSIEVTRFYAKELDRELFPRGATTENDEDDRTDIRVPLPTPLAPGATLTIETEFTSKLPAIVLRTGFDGSFHMVGQWFPKLAKLEDDGTFAHFPFQRFSEFYADYGDYDVTVDVPESFVVGATGVKEEERVEGGTRRVRYAQKAVHDFAFTAWDGFQERNAEVGGVKLRCLFPKGYEHAADAELAAATGGLERYGALFGEYPYPTLTLVHPPSTAVEAGGMEYPTLITTGGPAWLGALPVRPFEQITLHELGHQWFYGLVATNENRYPFLDEGLTTYATGEAAQELYGDTEITSLYPLETAALDRYRGAGVASHASIATGAGDFVTGGDYGTLVYARTATVLRTIDRVWNGAALRALSSYARTTRFRHPGPDALEKAIREAGGPEAASFFHTAVFERGSVDFEPLPAVNVSEENGGFSSEVVVRRSGTLVVPVEILVGRADGSTETLSWDGVGDSKRFVLTGTSSVTSVVVDPQTRLLIDEDKLNDRWTSEVTESAPRTRALATTIVLAALGSVLP